MFLFDLKVFVLLFLSISALWVVYFGVYFDQLIPGYDALAYLLDTELLKGVGFNFKEYLYRYEILGGTQIYDIYGMPGFLKLYNLVSFLDLHPLSMFNGYIIYYQLMLGYFGLKSAVLFREHVYGTQTEETLFQTIIGIVFAFLPMLGLRITHGHVNPELITIPLFFTVILGFQYARFSWLDLILVNVCLFTISPPNGQLAVYVVVFPILVYIGLIWEKFKSGDRRVLFASLAFLVIAAISTFMICLPELIDRMSFLKSSDALRTLKSSKAFVYSYTIHSWNDFLANLTFILEPFTTRENPFHLHETNYPTGPLIFLPFLLPWKKHRPLMITFLLTFLIIFGLSMNIWPIQDIVLTLNPILKGFRVPARSISIFVIFTFIFSIAIMLEKVGLPERVKLKSVKPVVLLCGLAGILILLVVPPVLRDVLFLIAFLSVAFHERKPFLSWNTVAGFIVMPALAATVLSSFKERYKSYNISKSDFDFFKSVGSEIKKAYPVLNSPLTRVTVVGHPTAFANNTSLLMGLSSIDAYRLMQRRFYQLVSNTRFEMTSDYDMDVHYLPDHSNYDLISNMYNIKAMIGMEPETKQLGVKILERESRPAWFVSEILSATGYSDLIDNKDKIYEKAYVLEAVDYSLPGTYDDCTNSTVKNVDAKFNDQNAEITLATSVTSPCPLLVATNYTEKLQAFDKKSGNRLEKFPAWGSLMGIVVPAGATEIQLRPEVTYPEYIDYLGLAGWILMFLNILFVMRNLLIPLLPGNRRNST